MEMRSSNRETVGFVLSILLYTLTWLTAAHAEEFINVIPKNFFEMRNFHGRLQYSSIVEKGIPASEHILIVTSCHCLDDATDKRGNAYYFYMVDRPNGLKALITETQLNPAEKLDEKIRDFLRVVKEEVRKDGGTKSLIEKFKRGTRRKR